MKTERHIIIIKKKTYMVAQYWIMREGHNGFFTNRGGTITLVAKVIVTEDLGTKAEQDEWCRHMEGEIIGEAIKIGVLSCGISVGVEILARSRVKFIYHQNYMMNKFTEHINQYKHDVIRRK